MAYDEFPITDVMRELCGAFAAVSANVFVGDRPKAVSPGMSDFVVARIGGRMASSVHGGDYGNVSSTLSVSVYVKQKAGGRADMTTMGTKLSTLIGLMPLSTEHCEVVQPKVLFSGSDGMGFHAVMVSCRLRIK